MRIFLAILLSDELRQSLAQISGDLEQHGFNVKWVGKDNYHITLYFFGDLEAEACNNIIKTMPEMVLGLTPVPLALEKIGAFPSLRRPRVLWAGVNQGRREIIQIHRNILSVLKPLGFTEKKKFFPHVTIGRVRSQDNLANLMTAVEEHNRGRGTIGKDLIQGISLMESTLTSKGAVYNEIAFNKFKT